MHYKVLQNGYNTASGITDLKKSDSLSQIQFQKLQHVLQQATFLPLSC